MWRPHLRLPFSSLPLRNRVFAFGRMSQFGSAAWRRWHPDDSVQPNFPSRLCVGRVLENSREKKSSVFSLRGKQEGEGFEGDRCWVLQVGIMPFSRSQFVSNLTYNYVLCTCRLRLGLLAFLFRNIPLALVAPFVWLASLYCFDLRIKKKTGNYSRMFQRFAKTTHSLFVPLVHKPILKVLFSSVKLGKIMYLVDFATVTCFLKLEA